jgi:peptidoglycan/LPS O-acetylase OafA/YrhL
LKKMATTTETSTQTTTRIHLDFLDGLRCLAALYVVMSHILTTVWSDYPPHTFAEVPLPWFKPGHFAVTIFIVISGFCLMLPVVRNGLEIKGGARTFFLRRVHRILPPYYLALLFSLALIAVLIGHKTGAHWDYSIPVTSKGLLVHALLLQDIRGNSEINHPLWSVAVECHIYLLFPVIIWLWRKLGAWGAIAIVTAASAALWVALTPTTYRGLTAQFIAQFGFGMLAAQIAFGDARWTRYRDRFPWLTAATIYVAVCCSLSYFHFNAGLETMDWVIGPATAVLLVSLCRQDANPLRRLLSLKPLVWIGTFSYSVYLIHAPLVQALWQYGARPLHLSQNQTFAILASAGLPLIIMISYLFFWVAEKPFLNTPATTRK